MKFEPQLSFDQKKNKIELHISKLGSKIFKELKSLEKKKQIIENQDSKILLLLWVFILMKIVTLCFFVGVSNSRFDFHTTNSI